MLGGNLFLSGYSIGWLTVQKRNMTKRGKNKLIFLIKKGF